MLDYILIFFCISISPPSEPILLLLIAAHRSNQCTCAYGVVHGVIGTKHPQISAQIMILLHFFSSCSFSRYRFDKTFLTSVLSTLLLIFSHFSKVDNVPVFLSTFQVKTKSGGSRYDIFLCQLYPCTRDPPPTRPTRHTPVFVIWGWNERHHARRWTYRRFRGQDEQQLWLDDFCWGC